MAHGNVHLYTVASKLCARIGLAPNLVTGGQLPLVENAGAKISNAVTATNDGHSIADAAIAVAMVVLEIDHVTATVTRTVTVIVTVAVTGIVTVTGAGAGAVTGTGTKTEVETMTVLLDETMTVNGPRIVASATVEIHTATQHAGDRALAHGRETVTLGTRIPTTGGESHHPDLDRTLQEHVTITIFAMLCHNLVSLRQHHTDRLCHQQTPDVPLHLR